MSISEAVKSLCKTLGKKNKATYVMVSVAVAKGIFRPAFTMSDKKESLETRKATAWREGLTELIAIPIYLATDTIVKKITKKLVPPNAPDIRGIKAARIAETNLNLLGICFSAGVVIPAICFFLVRNVFGQKDKNKKTDNNTLNVISDIEKSGLTPYHLTEIKNSSQSSRVLYQNTMSKFMHNGMRVG